MAEYVCELPIEDMVSFVSGTTTIPVHERIVRCRDCRHMHIVRAWTGMDAPECWLHASRETGALGKNWTDPNGFCAWGERREVDA